MCIHSHKCVCVRMHSLTGLHVYMYYVYSLTIVYVYACILS